MAKANKQTRKLLEQLLGSGLTAPLSGKKAKREIRAQARLAYGPQQRALREEAKISRQHQQQMKGYFKDYQQAVKGSAQRTQDAYANAQQAQLQAAQNLVGQNNQGLQALDAQRQSQANLYGQAPSSAANTVAQAQTAQTTQLAADAGSLAGQGASQQAYLQDKRRIGKGARNEALMQEMSRRRSIHQEKKDLMREKGAFKASKQQELRGAERAFLIDLLSNNRALKQLGLQKAGQEWDQSPDNPSNKPDKGGGNKKDRIKLRKEGTAYLDALVEKKGANAPAFIQKNKKRVIADLTEKLDGNAGLARKIVQRYLSKSGPPDHGGNSKDEFY